MKLVLCYGFWQMCLKSITSDSHRGKLAEVKLQQDNVSRKILYRRCDNYDTPSGGQSDETQAAQLVPREAFLQRSADTH